MVFCAIAWLSSSRITRFNYSDDFIKWTPFFHTVWQNVVQGKDILRTLYNKVHFVDVN